jgi:hypothetical protein
LLRMNPVYICPSWRHTKCLLLDCLLKFVREFFDDRLIWIAWLDVWVLLLLLERGYLNRYLRVSFYFLSDHQIFQRIIMINRVHHIVCAWIFRHHCLHGCAGMDLRNSWNFILRKEWDMLLDDRLNLLVH